MKLIKQLPGINRRAALLSSLAMLPLLSASLRIHLRAGTGTRSTPVLE